jgi:hypothetical protein
VSDLAWVLLALSAGGLVLLLAMWQFWLLYLGAMAIYRAYLLGSIPPEASRFVYATIVVALLVDWVANFTVAVVLFRQWPQHWQELVTHRLVRYINLADPQTEIDRLRKHRATIICSLFLDPFDPNPNGHCTLAQGEFLDPSKLTFKS